MILRSYRSSSEAFGRRLSVKEKRRRLRHELLEGRRLLAVGPQLLGIDHNNGVLIQDGSIHHTAPTELTFRFEEGADLDPETLGAIKLVRSGKDGVFDNGNDVEINPGFLDLGQTSFTVIMRFQETLPDDLYRIDIQGTGAGALRNNDGDAFRDTTDDGIDNGQNFSLSFDLQLGAQVISVVPQPVRRDPVTGALSQATDQIEVHFNDDALNPATASNPAFYRLIDTLNGAMKVPESVDYDPATNMALLTFDGDLSTATYELQIGATEESNDSAADAVNLGTINQRATAAVYESPERKDQDGNVVPTPIPDNGAVVSAISVIDSFLIEDVNVGLNIDHQWGPDLRVFLQGPGGQRVELIRDLGSQVRGGQIYGAKYDDLNGNGIRDENEPGLPGWTIFIDSNGNGKLDPGELSTVTDAEGRYSFVNLEVGRNYSLLEIPQPFWRSTVPTTTGAEFYSTDFSDGSTQTLSIVGENVDENTDGFFRLGFSGRTTLPIEFAGINQGATTAANIQSALEEILDPAVAVDVTPVSGTEFAFAFSVAGVGTALDHPALVVVDNQLNTGQLEITNAGDASGFTSSGTNNLWHLSSGRAQNPGHTPQFSFYFGQNETATGGGTYVNNADATLRSPEIDLTDPALGGPITLRLNHLLATEANFDFAQIRVVADGEETVLLNTSSSTSGWEELQLNLTQFAGKRIFLEFNFRSDVSVIQEGWYVDDIRIVVGRAARSVSLTSNPQQQVIKNVNFGSQRRAATESDLFGYRAFQVGTEFTDISVSEDAQRILQQFTDTGFASQLGGSGDDSLSDFTVDAAGNRYLVGSFQGTVDFDLGPGSSTLTSSGGNDVFVAKYDSDGALLWARRAGSASSDVATSVVVDSAGNVIVGGSFSATANFGGSNLTSNGSTDAFVWKLDGAGNTVWARAFGGTAVDEVTSVDVQPNGDVVLTGYFSSTVDFDPGPGTQNLTSAGSTDVFVTRMSSTGNLAWVRRIGGTGPDRGAGIHVTDAGHITLTGSFSNTVDFNPGVGVDNRTSAGSTDLFITQFGANGNYRWTRTEGSPLADRGTDVTSDAEGNVYATGTRSGDVVVVLLSPTGSNPSVASFGGSSTDVGEAIYAAPDGSEIYVVGSFRGTVNFGGGNVESAGGSDAFLLRYSDFGVFASVNTFGGPLDDAATSLFVEDADSLLVGGGFRGTAEFNVGTSVESLTSNGVSDGFLAKIAKVVGVDDGAVELTAADLNGFEFDFYGTNYDSLFVSSNGLLSFGIANTSSANTDLLAAPDEAIIAAFWEDLRTGSADIEAVFWEVRGSGDEQRLIVQWNNVRLDSPNAAAFGALNFQAILHERDGTIQLNYQTVSDPQAIAQGPQQPVGTFTKGNQVQPAVASDADGNYVVVWNSPDQDGNGFGVFARRYDADGNPLGNEFLVNETTAGDQSLPRIDMNASGRFVITWHGNGDGDSQGVLARVYNAAGDPVTDEFRVHSDVPGSQSDGYVRMDDAGNFVIAWHGEGDEDVNGVYLRRFNSGGQPLGLVDEIQRLTFLGPPLSGRSYTLIHDGQETAALAFTQNPNQTAGAIQNALRGLGNTGDQIQVVALQTQNEVQQLTLSDSPIVEDEVQTITFSDDPTSGTFQLDFASEVTANIDYAGPGMGDVTAANIQAALEALMGIGAGDVLVEQVGTSDFEFTVTFIGALAGTDVAQLVVTQQNLDQGSVNIQETTTGTSGGSFVLSYEGVPTAPIVLAGAATAANIQAALEALPNIGMGNVTVAQVPGSDTEYRVTFTGALGGLDVPLLELVQNDLDQGSLTITEVAIGATRGQDFEVRFLGPDGGRNQPLLSLGFTQNGVTHVTAREIREGSNGELRVNNETADVQQRPRVDMRPTGEFVVAWESFGQDGNANGVFKKRFDANGVAIEEEFDEVQRLVIEGPPGAGSVFRLRMGGPGNPATGFINYAGPNSGSQTAANIQAALQALPGFADISVSTTPTFQASNEIQELIFTAPLPSLGTFRLAHRGLLTDPIDFEGNAAADAAGTAMNIQDALRALPNTAADQITVVPRQDALGDDIPFQFVVTFLGPIDGGINHPQLVFLDNQLNQGGMTINTIDDGGTLQNEFIITYGGSLGRQDHPDIELVGTTGGVTAITVEELVRGVNSESQVNVEIFDNQNSGDVATRDDGSYLIVWNSFGQDGDGAGVFGKLFAANGDVLRDEFQINTFTQGNQARPRVDTDASGNFVVTWRSEGQDGAEGGVYARRLGEDGFALGDEFQVHSVTAGDQAGPEVAVNPDGSFTIVWSSTGGAGGIFAQRFMADETPVGSEVNVSQFGLRNQQAPEIARADNGDYVLVWLDAGRDPDSSQGVYAQLFEADGTPRSPEFPVASNTALEQFDASVSMDADGNFVVTWISQAFDQDDNQIESLRGRRFSADGTPLDANDFVIVEGTVTNSDVGMNRSTGDFVVVWNSLNFSDPSVVAAKVYDANGVAQTGEVTLFADNDDEVLDFDTVSVAVDDSGVFSASWMVLDLPRFLYDIHIGRYDSTGSPLAEVYKLDERSADRQSFDFYGSDLSFDSSGVLTAVWGGLDFFGFGGEDRDILLQRFDTNLQPLTEIVTVNDDGSPLSTQYDLRPKIAQAEDDSFVVSWWDPRADSDNGILVQRFDADANLVGPNTTVVSSLSQFQESVDPVIIAGDSGSFRIAYLDDSEGLGLFTRAFTSDFASVGIKAAGAQNAGENVLPIWVDGTRTALVGPNTSTRITVIPEVFGRLFARRRGCERVARAAFSDGRRDGEFSAASHCRCRRGTGVRRWGRLLRSQRWFRAVCARSQYRRYRERNRSGRVGRFGSARFGNPERTDRAAGCGFRRACIHGPVP
jgi:hypothetical protein